MNSPEEMRSTYVSWTCKSRLVVLLVLVLVLLTGGPALAFPTPGLVGSWDFDEGAGSVAADSSGNANDGSVINALWWSDSAPLYGGNSSLAFNGVNSEVSVLDSASLSTFSLTRALTAQAWINLHSIASFNRPIVGKWGPGSDQDDEWLLQIDPTGRLYFAINESLVVGQDDTILVSPSPLAFDQWYHVAATWSGNTQSACLYLNGDIVATTNTAVPTIADTTMALRIGAGGADFEHFDGLIDEVMVYDRMRSAEEIADDAVIPEPATVSLLGLGIVSLFSFRRRQKGK